MKTNNGHTATIWFKGSDAESWVTRFTVGEDYVWDTLLLPYDIVASIAHARGLVTAGVLTAAEFEDASQALNALKEEWEAGEIQVHAEDEDCHTVIERELTDRIGEIGKKIHTGRSRNDQVLAAIRLYIRDSLDRTLEGVHRLVHLLCDQADDVGEAVLPGYTHFQRAMPSTVALWALGYAELLTDDLTALREARGHINVSPLGSAAGFGVPYLDLPREQVAEELGFDSVQRHVTSVQLSRGKLELHVVHAFVQVAATINRLASDLIQFNSAEFGFVNLPVAYCTGSSIMPQKKNPDVLELARATLHRLTAEMHLLVTLPANLPSGYHRDLQLTKAAVMRASQKTEDLVAAMNAFIPGISFNGERLAEATTHDLYATATALRFVRDGVPFRDAYREAAENEREWTRDAQSATYLVSGYPGKTDSAKVRNEADAVIKPGTDS